MALKPNHKAVVYSEEYTAVRDKLLARMNEFLDDIKHKKSEDLSPVEATNFRTITSFFETQEKLSAELNKKGQESEIDFMDLVETDTPTETDGGSTTG